MPASCDHQLRLYTRGRDFTFHYSTVAEKKEERGRKREMATLTLPTHPPSPRDDAIELYRAFKGFGCDSGAVVNIIAHRDATQRRLIQQEYRAMYSQDLSKKLGSELSGNLAKAALLWMHEPAERDAVIVRRALIENKDLEVVTEVICSRTPSQIQTFKQLYYSIYGGYLEHDIEHKTSGDHKKLLLAYISKPRNEGPEVDHNLAENDAKALYKAGEGRLGTDEKTFIQIFSDRSRAHLSAVSWAYFNQHRQKPLKKAIKSETSGLFLKALLTILNCAENPAAYFAKVLHRAMKGLGTKDSTLIRVIVTRAEIDLQHIKGEYTKKHRKALNDAVHSETSGDYQKFLLALLGPS